MATDGATQCLVCSAVVPMDAAYCPDCGSLIGWDCPQCGSIAKPGDHFCLRCGTVRATARRDYLPMERKLVTVLFVDVRSSFELIHGKDPEHIDEILTGTIDRMRRSLHAFGGTVCRVVGDGVLALFGAPVAAEDHAVRACHAALALIQDFRAGQETGDVTLEIRVGLSSGEVLVTTAATDTATNYDAKGEDVYLAARMEQMASPGSIQISDSTRRLVDGYFELRSLGPTAVKGLPEPVDVHVLLRAKDHSSRIGVAIARGLSPMVDRQYEQAMVARLRQEVISGSGRTLVVRGEAGHGKSRLVYETVVSQVGQWFHCPAQALPYGRASFRTIRDLMAFLLRLPPGADADGLAARVAEMVGPREAAALHAAIAALYGHATDDADWRACGAEERLRRIQDAVCAIVTSASRNQPLALVVEDAQWIDTESWQLLRELMRRAAHERVLLAVTCRPEFNTDWPEAVHIAQIELPPLSREDMRTMFGSLVEVGDSKVTALESFAITRAGGNPFFLEETLAVLADDGALARTGGGYRLARHSFTAPGEIPWSVRSLLSDRIDRLSRSQKGLLQTAAVIGQSGSVALLQHVAGLGTDALAGMLERLRVRGFLLLIDGPEPNWKFRHALTQEAAYAGVPHRRRVAVHRSVVEGLEARLAGRRRENLELLAYHAEQGELWSAAAGYAYEAGKAAAWWRRAHEEALRLFRQALACAERLPDNVEKFRLALDLQLAMREPLMLLGRMTAVSEVLAAAEPLARALEDRPRLGLCLVLRCHAQWFAGDIEAALRASEEAIAIATQLGDPALTARAHYQAGLVWYSRGDYKRALAALAEPLAASGSDPTRQGYQLGPQLSVTALSYMARVLADIGSWTEAWEAAERARRLADSLNDPAATTMAMMALGHVQVRRNDHAGALRPLRIAMNLSTSSGARLMWPVVANLLGTALVHTGKVEPGLALLEQSVTEDGQLGMRVQHPARRVALADGYLAAGRRVQALVTARKALADAERQQEQGVVALALMLIGQAIGNRRPRAARNILLRARAESRRLLMMPTAEACEQAIAGLADVGTVV